MSRNYVWFAGIMLVFVVIVASAAIVWHTAPSEAELQYQQALNLERQGNYTQAGLLYRQALPKLLSESSPLTQSCREGAERIDFPISISL